MDQVLKFFSFAAVSLLVSVSSAAPLMASEQAQQIPNSETEAQRLSQEERRFNRSQLPGAHTFEKALDSYRNLNSRGTDNPSIEEINNISKLVKVSSSLKDSNNAIQLSKTVLGNPQKSGERETELNQLIKLGESYNSSGDYQQAVESATISLSIAEELQNPQARATAFVTLASAYQSLASNKSEYQKATNAAISGLTAAWEIKDYQSEAKALAILASTFSVLSQHRNALAFAQQGFKIAKENNIPTVAASSLLTLASVHLEEGEYEKVIEYTQQSRDSLQKLQYPEAESAGLVMQSLAYHGQGSTQISSELVEQGLTIARDSKSPLIEALGLIVSSLNANDADNFSKAIELINQSRIIAKEQNNSELEAFTLELLGSIYRNSGNKQLAIASYQEAISLTDSYIAKAGLARVYQDENLLSTAITYYKQAINTIEAQPQKGIPGLPIWLKESFPKAVQDLNGFRTVNIYRSLTNLLLSQRRIPEAQQVLELLKEQELREYTGNTDISIQPVNLTMAPAEEEILKEYGSLITFGQRVDECQQNRCSQLEQMLEQRSALTEQYYQALEQLEIELSTQATSEKAFVNPSQFALKAQAIAEEQPDTVLIYPLVLQDKIWLLWASKGGIFKSVEVTGVSQSQLEVTVLRFRQLVQNRLSDIDELKATGKQLYDWLIKPVEQELKANNIQNLVFSLDRSTRYIPMSALYDGEKFLVENYAISTVLSANMTATQPLQPLSGSAAKSSTAPPPFTCGEGCKLTRRQTQSNQSPSSDTTSTQEQTVIKKLSGSAETVPNPQNPPIILGLGVSDAVGGFQALPNVPEEIDAIVRQETDDSKGIYPGQKFLNKAFDFFALRDNLANRQILHIATHSEFVPGRAYKSFLLLGTGEKFAIPDIETWLKLNDINLVVLSACETALGGPGLDGREINGIAYYFLKGGAKTVMASLWRIDDLSTRLLMQQFYENLAKESLTSPVTKAGALRQAQLALLNGKQTTEAARRNQMPKQKLSPEMQLPIVDQPNENPPPKTIKSYFNHPYYWASFILMGSGGVN